MATTDGAALSGFPARRRQPQPADASAQQPGVAMPPPAVPAAPGAPTMPLTAENGYGTIGSDPLAGGQGGAPAGGEAAPVAPGSKDWLMSGGMQSMVAPPPAAVGGSAPASPPAVGSVDWLKQPAGTPAPSASPAGNTPPPSTPKVASSGAAALKAGDPGYSTTLDPSSPDYDPILASQLNGTYTGPTTGNPNTAGAGPGGQGTGQDAGTKPGDATKPGGTKATDTTPPPATAPAPAPVASPSSNPADYKPTQTAAGDATSGWDTIYQQWLQKQMGVSNPYDSDYVKQGLAVINDEAARQEAAGLRQIEQHFASRGLTGSSLEATAVKDFQAQMEEQRRSQAFQLTTQQAQGFLQQEQTVGNLGTQFGQNLNDQQKTALADIQNQMSMALQKYGIDKESADRMASNQLTKDIADANRTSTEKMHKQDLLAQYYQAPTADEWDAYARQFGNDAATSDLGTRPKGSTTTDPATTPKGTSQTYPDGTKPSTAPTDNAEMNSDIYNYKGINAANPDTLSTRQQRYDAFSQKYGADSANKYLGTRPAAAGGENTVSGLSQQQSNNWMSLLYAPPYNGDTSSGTRVKVWDDYASKHGASDAQAKLGPRPTSA